MILNGVKRAGSGCAQVVAGAGMLLSMALLTHSAGQVQSETSPKSPANPIFVGADPDVLLVDDTVWVYPTHWRGSERSFYAYSSKDLVSWETHGPILKFSEIGWIPPRKRAWAPGIAHKDGTYYLYYSVGPKPSHIGVAVSKSPAGPFVDSGQALLSDLGNPAYETIDAMVFTDPKSGVSYLYAGGSAGSRLLVYELNDDMVSLKRQIDADNPPYFTEGPFMHCRNGIYYLSYSHGVWSDGTYTVRYATSDTPYGPWKYHGIIMASDEKHRGPGHHSSLHNPKTDRWYIIYHRWNDKQAPGPYNDQRRVAIEVFEYDEQGRIKPIKMTDTGVGPVSFK